MLSTPTTGFLLKQGSTVLQNLSYTYDNANRLTGVLKDGTSVAAYAYDANGNRTLLSYANGTGEEYAYNLANAVTGLQNKQGTTVLSSYAYTYYLDGNQKTKTDHTGNVTTYVYDGMGRLSSESEGKTGGLTLAYTYDARSNRATMTATGAESYTTAYAYDAVDRLKTATKTVGAEQHITDYGYDPNGNLVSELISTLKNTDTATAAAFTLDSGADTATIYTYDGFNRQKTAYAKGMVLSYTYRPDGLRHSKAIDGATVTTHIWDGQNMAAELSGTSVKANYLRGANLLASEDGAGTRSYYLYNAHGDVVQLANAAGAVAKSYDYDAFGNEKGMPDAADSNPFRYCGEYHDAETGTIYLRARYYDPTVGRFTQVDPARSSSNWYIYALNNPILLIDPYGLFSMTDQMAEGASGYDVLLLQKELINAYLAGKIDSPLSAYEFSGARFGSSTATAVAEYNRVIGIGDSNIVNADTWGSLGLAFDKAAPQISRNNDFTAYVGVTTGGTITFYNGSVSPLIYAFDSTGKTSKQVSAGGGITTASIPSAYISGQVALTNAPEVDALLGEGMSIGISGKLLLGASLDLLIIPSGGNVPYFGIAIAAGVSTPAPDIIEVHINGSVTNKWGG